MMRCRRMRLTSAAAAVGLLVATAAMAHDDGPPRSCSGGGWTITVVAGPCPVLDNSTPSCAEPGPATGIQYQVVGAADVVATLATINNTVSTATGNVVYEACKGEPLTGIGKYSCQEQAIQGNLVGGKFWVVVDGHKGTISTSIVAKKGKNAQAFVIEGFGTDPPNACVSSCGNFDPDQTLTKTEVLKFKDCSVQFDFSLTTGEVMNAALTDRLRPRRATSRRPASTSLSPHPGRRSPLGSAQVRRRHHRQRLDVLHDAGHRRTRLHLGQALPLEP